MSEKGFWRRGLTESEKAARAAKREFCAQLDVAIKDELAAPRAYDELKKALSKMPAFESGIACKTALLQLSMESIKSIRSNEIDHARVLRQIREGICKGAL